MVLNRMVRTYSEMDRRQNGDHCNALICASDLAKDDADFNTEQGQDCYKYYLNSFGEA